MTELTQALLGVETDREQIDRTSTIGTTAERILDQNPNRLQLVFTNPSSAEVYIDTTSEVALDDGFVVPAGNGTLILNVQDDGDLPTSEWYAIAGSAGTTITHRGEEVQGQIPEPQEVETI